LKPNISNLSPTQYSKQKEIMIIYKRENLRHRKKTNQKRKPKTPKENKLKKIRGQTQTATHHEPFDGCVDPFPFLACYSYDISYCHHSRRHHYPCHHHCHHRQDHSHLHWRTVYRRRSLALYQINPLR